MCQLGCRAHTASQDDSLFVHFFKPRNPIDREYHGKRLDPGRFRAPDSSLPDARLTRWHYQQCVQAVFRGFSYNMTTPSSSAAAMSLVQGSGPTLVASAQIATPDYSAESWLLSSFERLTVEVGGAMPSDIGVKGPSRGRERSGSSGRGAERESMRRW